MKLNRIIIAGGGTGGHIFPAIAVANALRSILPSLDVLFVGAKGKMEMEKVPQAGYQIEGLDIAGFNRSDLWKNWNLPFKLINSFLQVRRIFKRFRPDAAFGVGGYSSFPVLRYAQQQGIPTYLHEANSFAGRSNMLLAKKATLVMTGTPGMDKFFPIDRLVYTGNPIRNEIIAAATEKSQALERFGLQSGKPTLLVMGGSLGARSINAAMVKGVERLIEIGVQVIWQTGKEHFHQLPDTMKYMDHVWVNEFIQNMSDAYAAADLVVSRAGAIALAEICACGKPSILVPFPHAAEDHQTANARVLVDAGAAWMIADAAAEKELINRVEALLLDVQLREQFSKAALQLAHRNADRVIAETIIKSMEDMHA